MIFSSFQKEIKVADDHVIKNTIVDNICTYGAAEQVRDRGTPFSIDFPPPPDLPT